MLRQREADTGTHADIHEQDEEYLRRCRLSARQIAQDLHWTVVNCAQGAKIRSAEELHEESWETVQRFL